MRPSDLSLAVDAVLAAVVVALGIVLVIPSAPPAARKPGGGAPLLAGPAPRPPGGFPKIDLPPPPAPVQQPPWVLPTAPTYDEERAHAASLASWTKLVAADPHPIPFDRAAADQLRADCDRYCRDGTVGVFAAHGPGDAPWADQARAALAARSRQLAASLLASTADEATTRAATAALRAAVAAGCDDPLVRYWAAGLDPHDPAGHPDAAAAYRDAVRELCESKYPAARKLHAAHNWLSNLVALPAGHPLRADEAEWEKRYWGLFDELAEERGRFAEGELVELAGYRVRHGAGRGGRTADANFREVEKRLKAAGATEYVRQTVRGIRLASAAWEARGNGTADAVTDDGWRLFTERLESAAEALEAAHAAAPDRFEAPAAMITVCMGRGDERAVMERWFGRAVRANPLDPTAYGAKLEYLKPKWHGTQAEYVKFGWAVALVPDPAGRVPEVVLASVGQGAPVVGPRFDQNRPGVEAYYADPGNWSLARAAAEAAVKARPDDRAARTRYARLACLAGRWPIAHAQLDRLGADYDHGYFPDPNEYQRLRDRAAERAARAP